MVNPLSEARVRAEAREGFAIPAVIFALVMMSMLAMVSLVTARDEELSSRAMHESAGAFYAAEAGYNQLVATWNDSLANTLQPGDSLDLGWQSLEGGASYRGVISRYDNGGQRMFALTVEGRGRGPAGSQRVLAVHLTTLPPIPITAAIHGGDGRGAQVEDPPGVSGLDMSPAVWGGLCTNPLVDRPGLEWGTDDVAYDPGDLLGDPPLVVDTTINSSNLFDWGGFNYDDLVAMANITLTGDPALIEPAVSGGACDTSLETNWGAPEDSTHLCFDYFPIIHAPFGELRMRNAVSTGQGVLLVDGDLRIEDNFRFYGIMIVKGDVRFEDNGTQIYGALIASEVDRVRDGAGVQYSQCAVNRALELSALQAVVGGRALLGSRSWGELMR